MRYSKLSAHSLPAITPDNQQYEHRKLTFSTLAHDTLGIIPLAAGVVTTLRTSAKNSVRELTDYTS